MSRSMIAITCILGSLFISAGASATGSPQPGLWSESDAPVASSACGTAWGTEEAPEAASDDRKLLSSSRVVQVGWNSQGVRDVAAGNRDLLRYTWSTGPAAARPRDTAAGGVGRDGRKLLGWLWSGNAVERPRAQKKPNCVSWNCRKLQGWIWSGDPVEGDAFEANGRGGRKLLGWLWSGNAVERPRAQKKSTCVSWNCRKLQGYPSGVEMKSENDQITEQGMQDGTVDGNNRRLQGYAWAGSVAKAPNPSAKKDCNGVNCRKLQGFAWTNRGAPDGRLVAGPADCIGANCRRLSGFLRGNNDVVARPRVKCQGVGWNCR